MYGWYGYRGRDIQQTVKAGTQTHDTGDRTVHCQTKHKGKYKTLQIKHLSKKKMQLDIFPKAFIDFHTDPTL